jgi:pantothenate kinase
MPMAFMTAVKAWNSHHKMVNTAHVWAVPRKGTSEHAEVKRIMAGEEAHKVVAPSRMSVAVAGLRKVEKETKARNLKRKVERADEGLRQANLFDRLISKGVSPM